MSRKRVHPAVEPLLDGLLEELANNHRCYQARTRRQVALLRHHGASWEAIADALEMHRSTAKRTFNDNLPRAL